MTPEEALTYLYAHEDRERLTAGSQDAAFDLRRMAALMSRLGEPHGGRLTVHVAGTKGKGSVAALIANVLSTAGHQTGLYTSPHLCDFRERIRVDGRAISPSALAEAVAAVKQAAEAYHQEAQFGTLTTFELTTAAAFLHFARSAAGAQVLEVGLGGRLDATNVIPAPDVAVITPLGLDHTEILGGTLRAIASEKAGIIKPGGITVMASQDEEAQMVIAERAYSTGAVLVDAGRRARWTRLSSGLDGQTFHVSIPALGISSGTSSISMGMSLELRIPLLGEFQVENAVLALVALEVLRERGVVLRREHIEAGLASVRWPGRLQVVRRSPLILVDGAHNATAARRLAEALDRDIPHQRLTLVVGLSSDKDAHAFAQALCPVVTAVVATQAPGPRAAGPAAVAAAFAPFCPNVSVAPDVASALRRALERASPGDAICVTGSLYIVGEALRELGVADQVLDLSLSGAGAVVAGVSPDGGTCP